MTVIERVEELLETAVRECRSEEPGGHLIATFPRNIEGTVRKEESKRKRQREAKAEREDASKRQKEDEVKQLKNLKKREVQDTCAPLTPLCSCLFWAFTLGMPTYFA